MHRITKTHTQKIELRLVLLLEVVDRYKEVKISLIAYPIFFQRIQDSHRCSMHKNRAKIEYMWTSFLPQVSFVFASECSNKKHKVKNISIVQIKNVEKVQHTLKKSAKQHAEKSKMQRK